MKKMIKFTCVILSVLSAGIFTLIGLGKILLPEEITVYSNTESIVLMGVYEIESAAPSAVAVSSQESSPQTQCTVTLFGIFPVENITTVESDRKYVYAGGNAVGIRLYTDGLLVVGLDEVITENGNVSPGSDCGIEVGDVIVAVEGDDTVSTAEFVKTVNSLSGEPVELTIKRGEEILTLTLTPEYSASDEKYRCGLWLRDSTAGIGTMTFIDEKTGMMASLGHAICDSDTQAVLEASGGDILSADISGITPGEKGAAGQLIGTFTDNIIGALCENNEYGVYGLFTGNTEDFDLYPVAGQSEIEAGSAFVLTTVDENGPAFYDIEIEKITYTEETSARNMVIKVTDEDLLNATGGIVQGMSGSPIIQNGMLVGAVTHVFLNDPSRGYAIFAETMVNEADQIYSELQF
ncbi:MAG: SpoIVB peptidase [Clostridiales bacterium]|nr:SpoIVB peptidase [Clostridiales bacterium]